MRNEGRLPGYVSLLSGHALLRTTGVFLLLQLFARFGTDGAPKVDHQIDETNKVPTIVVGIPLGDKQYIIRCIRYAVGHLIARKGAL